MGFWDLITGNLIRCPGWGSKPCQYKGWTTYKEGECDSCKRDRLKSAREHERKWLEENASHGELSD